MGRLRPFPIVGGAYTDDALPWAHQDTVNYLPVRAEREGTRSPAKLAMPPGMRVVSDVGTGPHRGGRDVEGQRFVVSGTTLYKVATDGVTTSCGTIPGTGRVRMTHNQITGGNQVFIATGSSGYVYNTVTDALVQVTDDAFPGAKSCDFLAQYILGVEPFGRYWFHSALVDATDYNSLDVFQAETSPDRIVGLIASHNEVLIFGERTIEPWSNAPTENAAFQLQVGSVVETGCASGDTLCRLDNSVYFLTDKGQVAKLEGYTPRIISTYAMEGAIKDCDLSRAFAFTWEDKGHTVYYITFPDGHTWGYDVRQNEWHRRESYGLDRWRLNTLFKSNGTWYGGDYQTGKLYRLDWTYALEGCDPIDRRRVAGYVHDNGEPVTVNAFQVQMDSGSEESVSHEGVTITGAMPDGFVGDTVNYQYTVTTAYPGQSYSLVADGLPDGVSLSSMGLATGTYNLTGTSAITITSADDCGNVTTFADSVTVAGFTIAGDVTDGYIGQAKTGSYTNTHGVEPITYAVTSGTFPAGLTLATDGTYSGSFTTNDTYSWVVTGTDSQGNTATVADTATVLERPAYWNVNDVAAGLNATTLITNHTRDLEGVNADEFNDRRSESRSVTTHEVRGSETGFRYFEIELISRDAPLSDCVRVGVLDVSVTMTGATDYYNSTTKNDYISMGGEVSTSDDREHAVFGTTSSTVQHATTGTSRVGVLVNLDNGMVYFSVDGVYVQWAAPSPSGSVISPDNYPSTPPYGTVMLAGTYAAWGNMLGVKGTSPDTYAKIRLCQYEDEFLWNVEDAPAWAEL